MFNLIGCRIFANSICKKQLIYFKYMYTDLMVLHSRKICGENFRRNYIIYHSLFCKNLQCNDDLEEKTTDLKKKIVATENISVIQPNGEEIVMSFKDAEAHAKRLSMKLVPDEKYRDEKKKFKLVKVSELFDSKLKTKDTKRIYFRQEIQRHDLIVKLRQCHKLVLKGNRVVCIVDGKDKNKLDNVVKEVELTEAKTYLSSVTNTSTGLNLIFDPTAKK